MRKICFVLLAALLFAACEKDYDNHYTIRRVASVQECKADGSEMRVSTYEYREDGLRISTTLDGALESVSYTRYVDNCEIETDSTVVDGVLVPNSVTSVYYRDYYRSMPDSVIVTDPSGAETVREEYSYDGTFYSIFTYKEGVHTDMKVIHSYTGCVSVDSYVWDAEKNEWKYVNKEETVTTYDSDLTTVTIYVDNKMTNKTIYQSLQNTVDFKRYKAADDGTWSMTSYGTYKYETITI